MARVSRRDNGSFGFGDGVRGFVSFGFVDEGPGVGMLGIEERIVRFDGS